METSQLTVILSAILFCFIFQTFFLKSQMSESLTSVEKTLQETHHQVETLSGDRLDKVSGILEESGKSFAETKQDIPSLISHLKQVHETQNIHEEKLLHVLSKLEQYETECDPKTSISEATFNNRIDQLAAKIDTELKHLKEGCHDDKADKPMYIIISYRQFLWFVLGILILITIQGFFKVENDDDVKDHTGIIAIATLAVIMALVFFHSSQ